MLPTFTVAPLLTIATPTQARTKGNKSPPSAERENPILYTYDEYPLTYSCQANVDATRHLFASVNVAHSVRESVIEENPSSLPVPIAEAREVEACQGQRRADGGTATHHPQAAGRIPRRPRTSRRSAPNCCCERSLPLRSSEPGRSSPGIRRPAGRRCNPCRSGS